MFELFLVTMLVAIVLLAVHGVYRDGVRREEEAWRRSGDPRLARRERGRARAALEKSLGTRTPEEFLATRACPACGAVVGAEAARRAEEQRVAFVERAHRRYGHGIMTASFERGPIPLRCVACGTLVAMDHSAPELRHMTEAEEVLFRSEFERQGGDADDAPRGPREGTT